MEAKFKALVKEAVLEALAETYESEISTTSETAEGTVSDKKKPGRPGPVIGPVGFSL